MSYRGESLELAEEGFAFRRSPSRTTPANPASAPRAAKEAHFFDHHVAHGAAVGREHVLKQA